MESFGKEQRCSLAIVSNEMSASALEARDGSGGWPYWYGRESRIRKRRSINKKGDACPPPGRRPAQSIAFQERIESELILHKEVFIVERTNTDFPVFIVRDGAVGRGCGSRDRDDLADGIRNRGVCGEAVIESVESGEGHAIAESGSHAITESAETVAVSERAEAAESVVIKGVREGIDRNQSGNRDEDDFISLAGLIQKKYSLESENRSKLQRAYE